MRRRRVDPMMGHNGSESNLGGELMGRSRGGRIDEEVEEGR